MDLFKTFTRGQENAQDQLNANFAALEGAVIVDSGSNVNGKWTKFSDGKMICRHFVKIGPVSATAGSLFTSGNNVWIYPAPFVAGDVTLKGFVRQGLSNGWLASGTNTSDGNQGFYRIMSPVSSSATDVTVILEAIGPWK